MSDRILRRPSVLDRIGKKRSSFYDDIERELFPPPVSLGARSVGWPESEVDAIVRARIAGKSDEEIRQLVADLVARRQQVA